MINSTLRKIQHANVLAGYFRLERSWNDLLVAWGIIRRRTKVGVLKFFKKPFLGTPFKIIRILSRTCTACVAQFFNCIDPLLSSTHYLNSVHWLECLYQTEFHLFLIFNCAHDFSMLLRLSNFPFATNPPISKSKKIYKLLSVGDLFLLR